MCVCQDNATLARYSNPDVLEKLIQFSFVGCTIRSADELTRTTTLTTLMGTVITISSSGVSHMFQLITFLPLLDVESCSIDGEWCPNLNSQPCRTQRYPPYIEWINHTSCWRPYCRKHICMCTYLNVRSHQFSCVGWSYKCTAIKWVYNFSYWYPSKLYFHRLLFLHHLT